MTGREKLNLIFTKMSNENLLNLISGSCPSEFDLFDKKETGCPVLFCTSCWKKALDMEYEYALKSNFQRVFKKGVKISEC